MELARIKELVEYQKSNAQRILEGDADNYDGAAGLGISRNCAVVVRNLLKDWESDL